MRWPALAVVLVLGSGAAGAAPAEGRVPVAVTGVGGGAGYDPRVLSTLEEMLASALAATGRFQVTGQSDIARLVGFERQKQLVGCSDGGCLAEIAGALGVSYVAAADLGRLGSLSVLSVKLIDVRTAEVTARITRSVADDGGLVAATGDIARELAAAVGGSGAPAATASYDAAPPPPGPPPVAAIAPPAPAERPVLRPGPAPTAPKAQLRIKLDEELGKSFDVRTFYREGSGLRPGPDCTETLRLGGECRLPVADRPLVVRLFADGAAVGGGEVPGAGDYRIARRPVASPFVWAGLALVGAVAAGAGAVAAPGARGPLVGLSVVSGLTGAGLLAWGARLARAPFVVQPKDDALATGGR